MRTLTDRVAVVTGAASGIGRALAVVLAGKGCDLALVDRDADGLAVTAALVANRRVSTHVVDVADSAAMQALPDAVITAHGAVHLLINNAGVALDGTFETLAMDDVTWLLGVNLFGVLHGCVFFLPHLRRVPEAHIVNVSSLFGLQGMPENSIYSASKFAVRGLSESLWVELAGTGIGVTCVHPGGVKTNIVRSARLCDEGRRGTVVAEFDRVARMTPEQAAVRIVAAVERGAPRVLLGPETYVIDWGKRLAPVFTQRVLAWLFHRVRPRFDAGPPPGPA